MGFFDGYVNYHKTSGGYEEETTEGKKYKSFHINDFEFFEGFGVDELKQLLSNAKLAKGDGFHIPTQKGYSTYLPTWYAEALINHYFKDVDAEVTKMKRHKHYDLILAWANGAVIQNEYNNGIWLDEDFPYWYPDNNYRIKPEPKPDVIETINLSIDEEKLVWKALSTPNLRIIFDGETGKPKSAEVIK